MGDKEKGRRNNVKSDKNIPNNKTATYGLRRFGCLPKLKSAHIITLQMTDYGHFNLSGLGEG